MQKAYKLHGVHRHYDWGGNAFIPNLMKVNNETKMPFAEYWMGAHVSAPALIDTKEGSVSINEFGSIPYLFKVLDVAKMLSIQVHPTKEKALMLSNMLDIEREKYIKENGYEDKFRLNMNLISFENIPTEYTDVFNNNTKISIE